MWALMVITFEMDISIFVCKRSIGLLLPTEPAIYITTLSKAASVTQSTGISTEILR